MDTREFFREKILFVVILVVWIVAVCVVVIPKKPAYSISLVPVKNSYYHHQFVELKATVHNATVKNELKKSPLRVSIIYDNRVVSTIGNITSIMLYYRPEHDDWFGRWPCPWNAPEGTYTPVPIIGDVTYYSKPFIIAQRTPRELPQGFAVMTYESNAYIPNEKPPLPYKAGRGNWKNLFDWCDFTGVDALWFLGGQTAYFTERLSSDFPWLKNNLSFLSTFSQEAERRGFQFGAYVMAYLTFGKKELKPKQYEYAVDYNYRTDTLYETRSISLRDKLRKKDIIEMLNLLDQVEGIDYIGLDYIRNALGGYELVDLFVHDMDVAVPEQWPGYTFEDRMKWLARNKIDRKDMDFIDQWQWWRAHTVATYVEEIIKEVNSSKPFWVFTLSWELGWQHGQDPVMMNDAGADIDAVMLYEANTEEFQGLLKQWRVYLEKAEANIIVGDVVDWNLHQKTLNPAGPEDYLARNLQAAEYLYSDGASKGIFLHDLHRIMWGRRGPYSRREWALAGAAAITKYREGEDYFPLLIQISVPETVSLDKDFMFYASITWLKKIPTPFTFQIYHSAGIISYDNTHWEMMSNLDAVTNKELVFTVIYPNTKRAGRHYIAIRVEWLDDKIKKSYSKMIYFSVEGYTLYPHAEGSLPIAGQLQQGRGIKIMETGPKAVPLTSDHSLKGITAGE